MVVFGRRRIVCGFFEGGVSDVTEGEILHLNYPRICILVGGDGVDCRFVDCRLASI